MIICERAGEEKFARRFLEIVKAEISTINSAIIGYFFPPFRTSIEKMLRKFNSHECHAINFNIERFIRREGYKHIYIRESFHRYRL